MQDSFFPPKDEKIFNITFKDLIIFDNTSIASLVILRTTNLLDCCSCFYYNFFLSLGIFQDFRNQNFYEGPQLQFSRNIFQ